MGSNALLERWRDELAAWAIPDHITAAVADSPWALPRQVFARRADRLIRSPGGPSYDRAVEALDPAGSVLDVGSGAGAACLPLAPRITTLTAVDTDPGMRPCGPAATDVLAILSAVCVRARHTEWSRPAEADYGSFGEVVEVTRRRLCLPLGRAGEVKAALIEMGVVPGRPADLGSSGRNVVTIWWEGRA